MINTQWSVIQQGEKKEVLTFATELMNHDMSEISQAEKDNYCMASLTCGLFNLKKCKTHRNRT